MEEMVEDHQALLVNIRSLLDEALNKYRIGEYSEAERLVVIAYLDNYELLEGDVGRYDKVLNEDY